MQGYIACECQLRMIRFGFFPPPAVRTANGKKKEVNATERANSRWLLKEIPTFYLPPDHVSQENETTNVMKSNKNDWNSWRHEKIIFWLIATSTNNWIISMVAKKQTNERHEIVCGQIAGAQMVYCRIIHFIIVIIYELRWMSMEHTRSEISAAQIKSRKICDRCRFGRLIDLYGVERMKSHSNVDDDVCV